MPLPNDCDQGRENSGDSDSERDRPRDHARQVQPDAPRPSVHEYDVKLENLAKIVIGFLLGHFPTSSRKLVPPMMQILGT
jgi:hypothetical protein